MNKATKKPVTIEYVTFEEFVEIGKQTNPESINGDRAWHFEFKGFNITHENDECYIIPTLEGNHHFTPNDVLIVGVKGEIYPCKKDIFEMTYDTEESTFETRLVKEFKDLQEKTYKLDEFLKKENTPEKVGNLQFTLLSAQLNCMLCYLNILIARLNNLNIQIR